MRQDLTDKRFDSLAKEFPSDLRSVLLNYSARQLKDRNTLYDFYSKSWLTKNLEPEKNDVVLDFGCGWGRLTKLISRKVKFVEGIDRANEMLLQARHNNEALTNFRFSKIEGNRLSFTENHFTKSFTCFVLQLLENNDLRETMSEFYRILRPNGRLILIEHVQRDGELLTVNIVRRNPAAYEMEGKRAGFILRKSIPLLRMPSYSMDLFEKFPLKLNLWFRLLMWIEKITVNRKPHLADHYAHIFVFEKPTNSGTLS